LAAYLVRARRWSAIATATLVSIVAVVVSALLLPGWWTPWLGAVAARRLVRSTQQPTLAGLAGDVAGDAWPLAWGVAIAALALLVRCAHVYDRADDDEGEHADRAVDDGDGDGVGLSEPEALR